MYILRRWLYQIHESRIVYLLVLFFIIRTVGFGLYSVPSESMETTMLRGENFVADKFTVWFKPPQRGDIISFNEVGFPYSENPMKRWFQKYIWGPRNITKRVIGVPGDTVEGAIEDGKPIIKINGIVFDEPYVNRYPILEVKTKQGGLMSRLFGWRDRYSLYVSYDKNLPFDQQPFYHIDPLMVIHGPGSIRYPNTPMPGDEFYVKLGENQYWVMGDNRKGSGDSRAWGILDGSLIHGKIVFRIFSIDSENMLPILGIPVFDLLLHPIDFWSRVRWNRCCQLMH